MTAINDPAVVVDNLKDGALDYLVKPVPLERLKEAIREALQKRDAMLHDRAQRKLLEEQITSHAKQMEPMERLRTLGQMVSGIAHDFSNALAPILGFTELLLQEQGEFEDKEKVRLYLERLRASAEDANSVIRRLREFYRPGESSELEPVDFTAVIQDVVALTAPKWRHQSLTLGTTITIEADSHQLPQIEGNAADLRAVMTNLLFNAVDSIHERGAHVKEGTITIRTYLMQADPSAPAGEKGPSSAEQVAIEMTDTGAGMTDEVLEHCMEPFISTKGDAGTGLGLTEALGIIQRHKGTLDIESVRGIGTTVTIRLPVKQTARKPA